MTPKTEKVIFRPEDGFFDVSCVGAIFRNVFNKPEKYT